MNRIISNFYKKGLKAAEKEAISWKTVYLNRNFWQPIRLRRGSFSRPEIFAKKALNKLAKIITRRINLRIG